MFGWTRIATLAAVAATLAMATGVAGATSKPGSAAAAGSHMPSASKITAAAARRAALLNAANLRTRAGAARYLRAIGVNPHHFVIQRGIRNYAGAKCPGAGWSCTSTAHPVIQIASAGGFNTFQCTTASCAVVQVSAPTAKPNPNLATCIKTTGVTQSCSITQSSTTAPNKAIVVETANKVSGLTQAASQTATITQSAASGSNTACAYQTMNVDGSTVAKRGVPVNVALEGHQAISITQDSASGGNSVGNAESPLSNGVYDCNAANPLTQSQTLTSKATGSGSIVQSENASSNEANLSLDIKQNQTTGFKGVASGANTASFSQTNTLTAVAATSGDPVTQVQGSAPDGGLLASVKQFSHDASTIDANQTETQCEHAENSGSLDTSGFPTLTEYCLAASQNPLPSGWMQVQRGPLRKDPSDPSTQGDNSADAFTVDQDSTQKNDTGNDQTNTVQGDCSTSGTSCTVSQDTTVNGAHENNTQTGSSVNTQVSCSGDDCTPSGGGSVVSVSGTGVSASNTDVGEFGLGGMRGDGTGSITAGGITGPVTKAFLYWNGPTNSSDPAANAAVTFNATPVTGTNIGIASDNNWGFQNGQSYRADVTSLVAGDGTYSLSDFRKPGVADINGVALIVFYNDGNSSNDRNVVAWNGNDSNLAFGADPANWDETISGVQYSSGSGSASLDLVVSDGQSYPDGALVVNGNTVAAAGPIFQGATGPNYSGNPSGVTGSLWDVKSFDITSLLTSGSNNLHLTSATNVDALSLVVAIANVPASAPVIP
jgi:hypothetical protein